MLVGSKFEKPGDKMVQCHLTMLGGAVFED